MQTQNGLRRTLLMNWKPHALRMSESVYSVCVRWFSHWLSLPASRSYACPPPWIRMRLMSEESSFHRDLAHHVGWVGSPPTLYGV